jgi:hypothetical protein
MADSSQDLDQIQKTQPSSEAAPAQPELAAPQPELDAPALSLSRGPSLGSPDGFEKGLGDPIQLRRANQQPRAQTLASLQRQFGNQHVQRLMVQRQTGSARPVQREEKKDADTANNITIDEKGVTNAVYNKPGFTTKNEKADPANPPKDVKPDDDVVTVTATAVCTFAASVSISLPSVPSGLSACQAKRVKDAIDNKLAPHEHQHEAAMKTYDGVVEENFTLTGIKRAGITAALTAKAKEIADRLQAERQKAAQDASDKLDQPPFVITVDLDCEDEKKPGKKDTEDAGAAQPELAGGGSAEAGAGSESATG